MKLYGITQGKKKKKQVCRVLGISYFQFFFFFFGDKLDQSYWEHFSNGQENSLF